MNDRMSGHLSEEALMRWQMGDATDAERAHVGACAECQAQARPLQEGVARNDVDHRGSSRILLRLRRTG